MKSIHRAGLKSFVVTLTLVMFSTNVVFAYTPETNFWKERQKAAERQHQKEAPPQLASLVPPFIAPHMGQILQDVSFPAASYLNAAEKNALKNNPATEQILTSIIRSVPGNLGTVRDIAVPSDKKSTPVLILLQDVHDNLEAQTNIAKLLRSLFEAKAVDLVGVEGAFDDLNLDVFKELYDADFRIAVADHLLETKQISGSVHAALSGPVNTPPLVGVDHPSHYQANVLAYQEAAPLIPSTVQTLKTAQLRLKDEKRTVFNDALLQFDSQAESFRSEDLSLAGYFKTLKDHLPAVPSSAACFLEAAQIEQNLNFQKVEMERAELLRYLTDHLQKKDVEALLQMSLAYRLKTLRNGEFYSYLQSLCEKTGVSLSRYPAMKDYLRYVLLADQIQPNELIRDCREMEKTVYQQLARSSQETQLIEESRQLYLRQKLAHFSLTPEEWKEYKETVRRSSTVDQRPFETFYDEAEARDREMTARLVQEVKDRGAQSAVLITGGFHSPGITKRALDEGFICLTVTPNVTAVKTESGDKYLSVFSQEKTPLEQLFEGEKLFLARHPMALGLTGISLTSIALKETLSDSPVPQSEDQYQFNHAVPDAGPHINVEASKLAENDGAVVSAHNSHNDRGVSLTLQVELNSKVSPKAPRTLRIRGRWSATKPAARPRGIFNRMRRGGVLTPLVPVLALMLHTSLVLAVDSATPQFQLHPRLILMGIGLLILTFIGIAFMAWGLRAFIRTWTKKGKKFKTSSNFLFAAVSVFVGIWIILLSLHTWQVWRTELWKNINQPRPPINTKEDTGQNLHEPDGPNHPRDKPGLADKPGPPAGAWWWLAMRKGKVSENWVRKWAPLVEALVFSAVLLAGFGGLCGFFGFPTNFTQALLYAEILTFWSLLFTVLFVAAHGKKVIHESEDGSLKLVDATWSDYRALLEGSFLFNFIPSVSLITGVLISFSLPFATAALVLSTNVIIMAVSSWLIHRAWTAESLEKGGPASAIDKDAGGGCLIWMIIFFGILTTFSLTSMTIGTPFEFEKAVLLLKVLYGIPALLGGPIVAWLFGKFLVRKIRDRITGFGEHRAAIDSIKGIGGIEAISILRQKMDKMKGEARAYAWTTIFHMRSGEEEILKALAEPDKTLDLALVRMSFRARPFLLKALKSGSSAIQVRLISIVNRLLEEKLLGWDVFKKTLIDKLKDANPEIREAAWEVIARHNVEPVEAMDWVLHFIARNDWQALARLGKKALEPLQEARMIPGSYGDWEISYLVDETIAAIRGDSEASRFINSLPQDIEAGTDKRATSNFLSRWLRKILFGRKIARIQGLISAMPEQSASILAGVLRGKYPRAVKLYAVEKLGALGTQGAHDALIDNLNNADAEIRRAAWERLPKDAALMVQVLMSVSGEPGQRAKDELVKLGAEAVPPLILMVASSILPASRLLALNTLTAIPHDKLGSKDRDLLIRTLRMTLFDPHVEVREQSVIELNNLGWTPVTDPEKAVWGIAGGNWSDVTYLGEAAVPFLKMAAERFQEGPDKTRVRKILKFLGHEVPAPLSQTLTAEEFRALHGQMLSIGQNPEEPGSVGEAPEGQRKLEEGSRPAGAWWWMATKDGTVDEDWVYKGAPRYETLLYILSLVAVYLFWVADHSFPHSYYEAAVVSLVLVLASLLLTAAMILLHGNKVVKKIEGKLEVVKATRKDYWDLTKGFLKFNILWGLLFTVVMPFMIATAPFYNFYPIILTISTTLAVAGAHTDLTLASLSRGGPAASIGKPAQRSLEELQRLYEQEYLKNHLGERVLTEVFSNEEIDRLFEDYLRREMQPGEIYYAPALVKLAIADFSSLAAMFDRDMKMLLLDDPDLRPVFLRTFEPLDEESTVFDQTRLDQIAAEKSENLGPLAYVWNLSEADRFAREGRLVLAVTDRPSELKSGDFEVANGRTAYIPRSDGSFLVLRGCGNFQMHKTEGIWVRAKTMGVGFLKSEQAMAERAQPLIENGALMIEPIVRKSFQLKPEDITWLKQNANFPGDGPLILVASRVMTPHRVSKIPQLLASDRGLLRLARRLSPLLAARGVIAPGTRLDGEDLIRNLAVQLGRNAAIRQNNKAFKMSLHAQDVTLAGEETWDELLTEEEFTEGAKDRRPARRVEGSDRAFQDTGFSLHGLRSSMAVLGFAVLRTLLPDPYNNWFTVEEHNGVPLLLSVYLGLPGYHVETFFEAFMGTFDKTSITVRNKSQLDETKVTTHHLTDNGEIGDILRALLKYAESSSVPEVIWSSGDTPTPNRGETSGKNLDGGPAGAWWWLAVRNGQVSETWVRTWWAPLVEGLVFSVLFLSGFGVLYGLWGVPTGFAGALGYALIMAAWSAVLSILFVPAHGNKVVVETVGGHLELVDATREHYRALLGGSFLFNFLPSVAMIVFALGNYSLPAETALHIFIVIATLMVILNWAIHHSWTADSLANGGPAATVTGPAVENPQEAEIEEAFQLLVTEANKIDGTSTRGSVRLRHLLETVRLQVNAKHFRALVTDRSHGFLHMLRTAEQAYQLCPPEMSAADVDAVLLGAFFHDIWAPLDRKEHEEKGAELARQILATLGTDPAIIESVARAVLRHNDENIDPGTDLVSALVRDADTLLEALDLDRIIEVSMDRFHRPFFNPVLTIEQRLKVLSTDERSVVEAPENDALLFLLRNVTKGIDPGHYVTATARRHVSDPGLLTVNRNRILELARARQVEEVQVREIEGVIDQVVKRYQYEHDINLPGMERQAKERAKISEQLRALFAGQANESPLEQAARLIAGELDMCLHSAYPSFEMVSRMGSSWEEWRETWLGKDGLFPSDDAALRQAGETILRDLFDHTTEDGFIIERLAEHLQERVQKYRQAVQQAHEPGNHMTGPAAAVWSSVRKLPDGSVDKEDVREGAPRREAFLFSLALAVLPLVAIAVLELVQLPFSARALTAGLVLVALALNIFFTVLFVDQFHQPYVVRHPTDPGDKSFLNQHDVFDVDWEKLYVLPARDSDIRALMKGSLHFNFQPNLILVLSFGAYPFLPDWASALVMAGAFVAGFLISWRRHRTWTAMSLAQGGPAACINGNSEIHFDSLSEALSRMAEKMVDQLLRFEAGAFRRKSFAPLFEKLASRPIATVTRLFEDQLPALSRRGLEAIAQIARARLISRAATQTVQDLILPAIQTWANTVASRQGSLGLTDEERFDIGDEDSWQNQYDAAAHENQIQIEGPDGLIRWEGTEEVLFWVRQHFRWRPALGKGQETLKRISAMEASHPNRPIAISSSWILNEVLKPGVRLSHAERNNIYRYLMECFAVLPKVTESIRPNWEPRSLNHVLRYLTVKLLVYEHNLLKADSRGDVTHADQIEFIHELYRLLSHQMREIPYKEEGWFPPMDHFISEIGVNHPSLKPVIAGWHTLVPAEATPSEDRHLSQDKAIDAQQDPQTEPRTSRGNIFNGIDTGGGTVFPDLLVQTLKGEMPPGSIPLVAEIGVGEGLIAEHLLESGLNVVGFDINDAYLTDARNRCSKYGQKVLLTKADVTQGIPLPDNSVDGVVIHRMLSSITDPLERDMIISEAYRIVRPGGCVSFLDYFAASEEEKKGMPAYYTTCRAMLPTLIAEGILPRSLNWILETREAELTLVIEDEHGETPPLDVTNNLRTEDLIGGRIRVTFAAIHVTPAFAEREFSNSGFVVMKNQEGYSYRVPGVDPTRSTLHGFLLQKPSPSEAAMTGGANIETVTESVGTTPSRAPPEAQPLAAEILEAAAVLSQQDANIVFEKNRIEGKWLFRRSAVKVPVPDAVSSALGRVLEKHSQPSFLLALRGHPKENLERALKALLSEEDERSENIFERFGIPIHSKYKKVVLVAPYGDAEGRPMTEPSPAYGIEALSYRLNREAPDVDARVYNPNLTSLDDLYRFVQDENPDIVGVSTLDAVFTKTVETLSQLSIHAPNSIIILGGMNLRNAPYQELFNALNIHGIAVDDGTSLIEATRHINAGETAQRPSERISGSDIKNLVTIDSVGQLNPVTVGSAEAKPAHENPYADIPYGQDLTHGKAYPQLQENEKKPIAYGQIGRAPQRITEDVLGNLCKGQCIFCSLPLNTRKPKTPAEVVDDIKRRFQPGVHDVIYFQMEDAFSRISWLTELAGLLAKDPTLRRVPKRVAGRADGIGDGKILSALKAAGFVSIAYGIESFSTPLLGIMRKHTTREQNINAIERTFEAEMMPVIYHIFLRPGDSVQTVMDDIDTSLDYFERGAAGVVVPYMNIFWGTPLSQMEDLLEPESLYFEGMKAPLRIARKLRFADPRLPRLRDRMIEILNELLQDDHYHPLARNSHMFYGLLIYKAFLLAYLEINAPDARSFSIWNTIRRVELVINSIQKIEGATVDNFRFTKEPSFTVQPQQLEKDGDTAAFILEDGHMVQLTRSKPGENRFTIYSSYAGNTIGTVSFHWMRNGQAAVSFDIPRVVDRRGILMKAVGDCVLGIASLESFDRQTEFLSSQPESEQFMTDHIDKERQRTTVSDFERNRRKETSSNLKRGLEEYLHGKAEVVHTGSVARETDLPGDYDEDFELLYHTPISLEDQGQVLLEHYREYLRQQGFSISQTEQRMLDGSFFHIDFHVHSNRQPFIKHIEITLANRNDYSPYTDLFNAQKASLETHFGRPAFTQLVSDIRLLKRFMRDIHAYWGSEGGLTPMGAEQLIIQSGGASQKSRIVDGLGSFDRAMEWIYREGFDPVTGSLLPLSKVQKRLEVFIDDINFLSKLTELTWRRYAHAAKVYCEGKKQGRRFDNFYSLRYSLETATIYRNQPTMAIELEGRDLEDKLDALYGHDHWERIKEANWFFTADTGIYYVFLNGSPYVHIPGSIVRKVIKLRNGTIPSLANTQQDTAEVIGANGIGGIGAEAESPAKEQWKYWAILSSPLLISGILSAFSVLSPSVSLLVGFLFGGCLLFLGYYPWTFWSLNRFLKSHEPLMRQHPLFKGDALAIASYEAQRKAYHPIDPRFIHITQLIEYIKASPNPRQRAGAYQRYLRGRYFAFGVLTLLFSLGLILLFTWGLGKVLGGNALMISWLLGSFGGVFGGNAFANLVHKANNKWWRWKGELGASTGDQTLISKDRSLPRIWGWLTLRWQVAARNFGRFITRISVQPNLIGEWRAFRRDVGSHLKYFLGQLRELWDHLRNWWDPTRELVLIPLLSGRHGRASINPRPLGNLLQFSRPRRGHRAMRQGIVVGVASLGGPEQSAQQTDQVSAAHLENLRSLGGRQKTAVPRGKFGQHVLKILTGPGAAFLKGDTVDFPLVRGRLRQLETDLKPPSTQELISVFTELRDVVHALHDKITPDQAAQMDLWALRFHDEIVRILTHMRDDEAPLWKRFKEQMAYYEHKDILAVLAQIVCLKPDAEDIKAAREAGVIRDPHAALRRDSMGQRHRRPRPGGYHPHHSPTLLFGLAFALDEWLKNPTFNPGAFVVTNLIMVAVFMTLGWIINKITKARRIERLSALLRSGEPEVRSWASLQLSWRPMKEMIPLLRQTLRTDSDPFARAHAATALAKLRDAASANAIIELLGNNHPHVRNEAQAALELMGVDIIPRLLEATDSDNASVRQESTMVLEAIRKKSSRRQFLKRYLSLAGTLGVAIALLIALVGPLNPERNPSENLQNNPPAASSSSVTLSVPGGGRAKDLDPSSHKTPLRMTPEEKLARQFARSLVGTLLIDDSDDPTLRSVAATAVLGATEGFETNQHLNDLSSQMRVLLNTKPGADFDIPKFEAALNRELAGLRTYHDRRKLEEAICDVVTRGQPSVPLAEVASANLSDQTLSIFLMEPGVEAQKSNTQLLEFLLASSPRNKETRVLVVKKNQLTEEETNPLAEHGVRVVSDRDLVYEPSSTAAGRPARVSLKGLGSLLPEQLRASTRCEVFAFHQLQFENESLPSDSPLVQAIYHLLDKELNSRTVGLPGLLNIIRAKKATGLSA